MTKLAESIAKEDGRLLRISEVRSWRAVLRRAVAWKTARYSKGDIEAAVVGLTDVAGITGYGYLPAMAIVGETSTSAEALLDELITPILSNREFIGIPPILKEIDFVLGSNFQLKFAIEEALFDLVAKKINTPVVNLLGGQQRAEVPIMRMLGLKPPEETAKEAESLVKEGYRFIKLKIGLDEKRDVETAERVRGAIGNDIFVSVDANQAYTPMQAVRVLEKLSKFYIGMVEQPVRQDDVNGMAFVRKRCTIPVMADEGIQIPSDALRHVEAGAMDAVSIKLWKMGGYYKSRDIASICASANVGVHIGSTAGSRLMEAMQLHFAASLPELTAGAEIGEFESLTNDPATGFQVNDGMLRLSNVPGLGVELDLGKMQETTRPRKTL